MPADLSVPLSLCGAVLKARSLQDGVFSVFLLNLQDGVLEMFFFQAVGFFLILPVLIVSCCGVEQAQLYRLCGRFPALFLGYGFRLRVFSRDGETADGQIRIGNPVKQADDCRNDGFG